MGSAAGAQQKKYRSRNVTWTVGDEALERAHASHRTTPEYKPFGVAEDRKPKKRWKIARGAVEFSLLAETAACNELWTNFEVELRRCLSEVIGQLSDSQEQVRSMLLAAVMVRDSNQLGVVMHRASNVGLRFNSKSLYTLLESLLAKEDLEGFWRCLSSALLEEDVLTLRFWLQEAKERHIQLPAEVTNLDSLKPSSTNTAPDRSANDERDSRFEELKESFEACVQDAYRLEDVQMLHQLYAEAKRLGMNSGMIEAAIIGLGSDLPQVSEQSRTASKSSYSNMHVSENASLTHLNIAEIKDELSKHEVDFRGVCEKQELVKLLLAARSSRQFQDSRNATNRPACPTAQKRSNVYDTLGTAGKQTDESSRNNCDQPSYPTAQKRSNVYDTDQPKHRCESPYEDTQKRPTTENNGSEKKQSQSGGAPGRPATAPQGAQRSETPPKKEPPKRVAKDAMTFAQARECLGIASGTPTAEEVRVAYKKAALKWHPDRKTNHGKEAEATKKFQEARTAFELLQRVST